MRLNVVTVTTVLCLLGVAGILLLPLMQPLSVGGTSLVIGPETGSLRILIRQIDDGPILWIKPGILGPKGAVTPGRHTLHAVCVDTSSKRVRLAYATATVEVQAGRLYDLSGALSPDGTSCNLAVSLSADLAPPTD